MKNRLEGGGASVWAIFFWNAFNTWPWEGCIL